MARLATWMAFAVAAAVIVGCGPAKELPDEIPKNADTGDKPAAVPAASEPAAKAYVDKAVSAFTGGKPELVAKAKASRVVLKGRQYKLGSIPVVETVRSVSAVWPDRYLDTDEQQVQGQKATLTAYLHRPNFSILPAALEQGPSNDSERERNFAADATAQHWMALFLPLTDPKAVVYDLQPGNFLPAGAAQPIPVQTLKLSLGEFPIYKLTFDTKSDLLLRVEYSHKQYGSPTRQTWTLSDHKLAPEGLLLPSKMELRFNNNVGEEWEVQKWEFPAAIADAEFSPPKK